MPQVLTANRLDDGRVVFLAAAGHWTRDLQAASQAHTAGEAAALRAAGDAAAARAEVVAPSLVAVSADGGIVQAVDLRERIRANGPTRGAAP